MRLLLDTHILLWALTRHRRLNARTRALLVDPANEVLFSAASIWEIAIKARLRRTDFSVQPDQIVRVARESGFEELPVRAHAAALVADLPLHHRDPFDRLLVAQAIIEPVRLYTSDPQLSSYSDLVVLIG